MTDEAKRLYAMGLHEVIGHYDDYTKTETRIMRVVGGWLYGGSLYSNAMTSVFVPFNDEFKST